MDQNDSNTHVPICCGCLQRVIASGELGSPSAICYSAAASATRWHCMVLLLPSLPNLLSFTACSLPGDDVIHSRDHAMWVEWRKYIDDTERDSDPENYIIEDT